MKAVLENIAKNCKFLNGMKYSSIKELSLFHEDICPWILKLGATAQVVNELKEHFQDMVFNTVIQRSIRLSEAPSHGKPIILYDVVSNGTTNYMNLAKEVLEKNER